MSFDLIEVIVAAIPATLALLLYGAGAPWWRSWPGRAFFSTMLALALLLDLTLLFRWVSMPMWLEVLISRTVIGVVVVACWLKLYAVVRQQVDLHPGRVAWQAVGWMGRKVRAALLAVLDR